MLTKDNNGKVMENFLKYPDREFHVRELGQITKLSPPGILKIIKKLEKSELVKIEHGRLTTNIKSSKTEKFIALKKSWNLFSLYNSGLIEYLKEKYEEPEAIVLFGSYSKGEDNSKSDIDIAIITNKTKELRFMEFEKKLARKISVQEIKIKEAEKEFLNALANGAVLYGYLQVLK